MTGLIALPVLLLPGTLCDGSVFTPILDGVSARSASVGDMTGLSTVGALADRLLETAPPRFALIGFSLGGIVALEMIARAPERIAGLALIAANAHPVPQDQHAVRRAATVQAVEPGNYVRETLWPSYVGAGRQDDTALRERIVAMADACAPGTLARQTEVALSRIDSRPRLSAIAVPVLVLGGTEDVINPPEIQRALAAAIPNATLELISGAGHFVPLEAPDACARALDAWLACVDDALFSSDDIPVEEA